MACAPVSSIEEERMAEEIPTELVLAAMERAKRQERYEQPGLHINPIKEHLGLFRRDPHLGRLLNRMMTEGLVEHTRTQGAKWWAMTTAGRRRLNKARKAGSLGELPESPQHKAWRTAHGLAETEIGRSRLELSALHGELSEPPSKRDSWPRDTGPRLRRMVQDRWRLRRGVLAHGLSEALPSRVG